MSDHAIETKPNNPPRNGAPGPRSPSAISVSFDVDAGLARAPVIDGRPDSGGRDALLARHQARLDAARGAPKEAIVKDAITAPSQASSTAVTIVSDEAEADAAESDAAPTEEATEGDAPVEGEQTAEAAPEGEQATPPPATPDPVQAFALQQANIELANTRRQLEEVATRGRVADFDTYFDNPVAALKTWIASTLGVAKDSPLVAQEAKALFGELTWDTIAVQDLPEPQQAELSRTRLDRRIRLESHRRQASKTTDTAEQAKVVRDTAKAVYQTVAPQFKAASLAEHIFRRPIDEIIVDVAKGAIQQGQIANWQSMSDAELFTTATKILDNYCNQWVRDTAPRISALTSPPAPTKPGTVKPDAAQTPATAQAAPPKATAKPRTLPQQKAGAAPAKPGLAKQETAALPLNPEERRMELIRRWAAK